jgi:hypothetical protein
VARKLHKLETALLLLLLALVPIRALAAATTGFCAFAHQHGAEHAAQGHASHDHGGPVHSHDDSPCSSCVEHCSSAAFAPSAEPVALAHSRAPERSTLQQASPPGFIADPLDPPPLVA